MIAFYRAAFWAALIFTVVMALLPYPPLVPAASDKLQHAAAFATLAALGAMAYRSVGPLLLFAALSVFGALIEIPQAIPALHRDSDPVDWLTDTVAAGVIVAVIYRSRRKRQTRNLECPLSTQSGHWALTCNRCSEVNVVSLNGYAQAGWNVSV